MVLDPSYLPGHRIFDDCFLFCCALESSCLGRLSAIKVQLELKLVCLHILASEIFVETWKG